MWLKYLLSFSIGLCLYAHAALPELGRAATPAEIKAWNIDVRSDFKGLPKGTGSVTKGADVWDGKCASCHGVFGESNEVFTPLVGGVKKKDLELGRVAAMTDGSSAYRTTLMKTSQVSTLWDYINRAMPWNAPKSLTTDEVYAVTAYLLNLGGIIADDFILSDTNIAQVQAIMPNRNGKTQVHGLWSVKGKPDVHNTACMAACGDAKVSSTMPDYARNAHGNLAEQNRAFGPYRGIDTTAPRSTNLLTAQAVLNAPIKPTTVPAASATNVASDIKPLIKPLLNKLTCTACHGMNGKMVGPSFSEIAKKYAGKTDAAEYLTNKIKAGGQGVWGATPMPAQNLPATDAQFIAEWLAKGAK